jgi:ABC-type cobalamin/Fe3+-siderophores transport system ATPase subunit
MLDEPFSHLDLNNAKIAMNVIISESKANKANIIITGLTQNNFYQADKTLNL